jgi:hypothetical protein
MTSHSTVAGYDFIGDYNLKIGTVHQSLAQLSLYHYARLFSTLAAGTVPRILVLTIIWRANARGDCEVSRDIMSSALNYRRRV